MSNYNETQISGQAWQRCNQVVIENNKGQTPVVRFDEEKIIQMEDGSHISRHLGNLAINYDASKVIELRDLTTGEPTGKTVTYEDAYVLLYSAYLSEALARDIANTPTVLQTQE